MVVLDLTGSDDEPLQPADEGSGGSGGGGSVDHSACKVTEGSEQLGSSEDADVATSTAAINASTQIYEKDNSLPVVGAGTNDVLKDTDDFSPLTQGVGFEMLKKMGWAEGGGVGKSLQGALSLRTCLLLRVYSVANVT